MNNYHFHDEVDYYSPQAERRRRRAVESLNSKPVISDGLKRIVYVTLGGILVIASSKVLYEVVKWLVR